MCILLHPATRTPKHSVKVLRGGRERISPRVFRLWPSPIQQAGTPPHRRRLKRRRSPASHDEKAQGSSQHCVLARPRRAQTAAAAAAAVVRPGWRARVREGCTLPARGVPRASPASGAATLIVAQGRTGARVDLGAWRAPRPSPSRPAHWCVGTNRSAVERHAPLPRVARLVWSALMANLGRLTSRVGVVHSGELLPSSIVLASAARARTRTRRENVACSRKI